MWGRDRGVILSVVGFKRLGVGLMMNELRFCSNIY